MVKQRILFLEDNRSINKTISMELKTALGDGVQVLSVYSLADARKMEKETDIDLAILDIELKDGSGVDFAYELREAHKHMPIMIASSYTTEQLHTRLNNAIDLFLCLKKPYTVEDILPKIISNLERVRRSKAKASFIWLKVGKKKHKFYLPNIIKVETVKRERRIEVMFLNPKTGQVKVQDFSVRCIDDFIKLLPPTKDLVRINQSAMVNPDFIIEYDNGLNELFLLHTDQILSISANYPEAKLIFKSLK